MPYKVDLDIYNGPMDLLLYLVRRDEVDIEHLPISRVTDQFMEYVDLLRVLDIEMAGDFLVVVATLAEMKSRALLPEPPPEEEEEEEEPGRELLRQLLAYRRYKTAATELDDRMRLQARKAPRQPAPFDDEEPVEIPLDKVLAGIEVWDLFNAFAKVVKSLGYRKPGEIVYDDTPIEEVAAALLSSLEQTGPVQFSDLFRGQTARLHLITTFLAILELMRQRCIRAEQADEGDEIRIHFVPPEDRSLLRSPVRRSPPAKVSRMSPEQYEEELRDILKDLAETETTEFDEAIKSINVPDILLEHPIDEGQAEFAEPAEPSAEAQETETDSAPDVPDEHDPSPQPQTPPQD